MESTVIAPTDTGNAPIRVATRDEILASPTVLFVTTDQVTDAPGGERADWVYVTLTGDTIAMRNLSPYSKLHHENVGHAFTDDEGRSSTLLGVYVIVGRVGSVLILRLMSNRDCAVYDWCIGHEDGSRDTVRHSAKWIDAFTFAGDDDNHRARVTVSPYVEADEKGWGVAIEYDLELNSSDLIVLADELEKLASKIRSIK